MLGLLLEKEQFNIARKYAELVNSTSSQITIKEVCMKSGSYSYVVEVLIRGLTNLNISLLTNNWIIDFTGS